MRAVPDSTSQFISLSAKDEQCFEAANKNIKKIIQKMTITYKNWNKMLLFALHGYRTTARTSTRATPYSLVYGMEAILPIEVQIPSLRIMNDAGSSEDDWIQTRLDQLNLIDEKRLTAVFHGQTYQKRMIKYFNKKVRHLILETLEDWHAPKLLIFPIE